MTVRILTGDCRERLREQPDASVQCVVTSPPYFGLRDYGVDGQIGREADPREWLTILVDVFREVRRVLRADGTIWLNIGDCYATTPNGRSAADVKSLGTDNRTFRDKPCSTVGAFGAKPKDLLMMPARLAIALQDDGWYLRSEIVWDKTNPMPESAKDRPTSAHEKIYLLTKSPRYYYDAGAIAEPHATPERYRSKKRGRQSLRGQEAIRPRGNLETCGDPDTRYYGADGRNARNVWQIATQPYSDTHFATFPPALAERCIKAGSHEGDTVLDPFGGAGTTGLVADRLGRDAILIELNPEYAAMAERRIQGDAGMFAKVGVQR